jgi:hypothetical protein
MTGITAGAFWLFQNNSGNGISITLTNGTATYNGTSNSGPIPMMTSAGITLVYSGSSTSYIVF